MLSFQIILSLRFTILTLFYFILFITHHLNGCEKFCEKIITLEILSNIIYNIPTLKRRRSITRIYEVWRQNAIEEQNPLLSLASQNPPIDVELRAV